jgi:hypothetical protein
MEVMKKPWYWKHISVSLSQGRLLLLALVILGVALSGSNCNAQDDSARATKAWRMCVGILSHRL